jgi:hypothetical protein
MSLAIPSFGGRGNAAELGSRISTSCAYLVNTDNVYYVKSRLLVMPTQSHITGWNENGTRRLVMQSDAVFL